MHAAVIGGSAAIGRAVVEHLAARGDRVLATWASRPFEAPDGVQTARLDLTDDESVTAFARTVASFGGLDVLVNLAAILPGRSLADYDLAQMRVSINPT